MELLVEKEKSVGIGDWVLFLRKIFFNIFEVMKNILFKLFYFFGYLIY